MSQFSRTSERAGIVVPTLCLLSLVSGCTRDAQKRVDDSRTPRSISAQLYTESSEYARLRSLTLRESVTIPPEILKLVKMTGASALPSEERKEFTLKTPPSKAFVLDIIQGAGFRGEVLPALLPLILDSIEAPNQGEDEFDYAFRETHRLRRDITFNRKICTMFRSQEMECNEISHVLGSILLWHSIQRSEQEASVPKKRTVNFVTGLVFDPKYAPEGIGHSWIQIDGQILDAALAPEGKLRRFPIGSDRYLPMVEGCMECASPTRERVNFDFKLKSYFDLQVLLKQ